MEERLVFTADEKKECISLIRSLRKSLGNVLKSDDEAKIFNHIKAALASKSVQRNMFGLNPILLSLQTAMIAAEEIGLRRDGILAILLYASLSKEDESNNAIKDKFGENVCRIIHGLKSIQELYKKNPVIESENFRKLLLSFAEDMRVILIMIADRVNLMRQIRDVDNIDAKMCASEEASYLYAPLAHKLGLYKLKSELEDLSLKYLEHDTYYMIKEKLNATKKSRDAYIERFIRPVDEKLKEAGLKFHMKGRTKSIHSIWQKMKKQQCDFEGIYDLFAIRIIIDSPSDILDTSHKLEKVLCWQVFALITNMYQPNPKRLRDWLSVPKSNGYESLHITVLGPENKWVEVQIRTERMDEVAEHGLAAHWRYKGVKGETGIDEWLGNIRSALENKDDLQVMDHFKMDLYEDEVFVFTPKGELMKFPTGSTVLDFAYRIHSNIGNHCTGARINDKVVTFRQELHNGDQVEIMTASNQTPKQEWISIVKTSRAKAKIRMAIKDLMMKNVVYAKEMFERRLKNRKIEFDESAVNHLIKKTGYKEANDFYKALFDEKEDLNRIIEKYQEILIRENNLSPTLPARSAKDFSFENPNEEIAYSNDDVLVIDKNLKGVDYTLSKCCHPIYGDEVFGFVTVNGGIKIHRCDCPNAPELRKRFGYRVVKARWSGKGTSQYSITLKVIGNDDIGIVNNITSIISKEEKIMMRSINIDSNDGLFRGNLVVDVQDISRLEQLIKKLRNVKGIKQILRM